MSGILLDQPAPGATTCIVIGAMRNVQPPDLGAYRAILWWTDAAPNAPLPTCFPPERTETARVGADNFLQTLERFVRLNPRQLPSLIVTRALNGATSDAYQRLISETHALLESTHRIRFTRQQDGFTWQKHILGNARAYAARRLPPSWAGAFRGLPAFVCGAGPSLDVSIEKLAGASAGAVIFSADSALRALARRGIQADFAVSIDLAKVPEKCLPPDEALAPSRVALASVSPPAWQSALPADRSFFLSGNQLTDDWFADQGSARSEIAVAESCGSTALELAHYFGCDPIYLFGMDLAVDPANQARRHQADADPGLYAKSNYDPTAQLPRVPGNYAETVPCFALGDWRELDARLAARTSGSVFNVNDRGARLRGTTLVHPQQFTLASAASDKLTRLSALPSLNSGARATEAGSSPAIDKLRASGLRCTTAIPALRRALAQGGPPALAEAFRPLLLDPQIGRPFGAFSLKLMPHLVPPIEGDKIRWEALLREFEELATLARAI
jgi:hypothetical protein